MSVSTDEENPPPPPPHHARGVSFDAAFVTDAASPRIDSGDNNNNTMTASSELLLDWAAQLGTMDTITSTYQALSSACRVLQAAGYGQVEFVPTTALDALTTHLERHKIDLSNVTTGFPYDASDLDDDDKPPRPSGGPHLKIIK